MNAALKSVAVTAFAAQTLEGETWQGMCRWVCDAIANSKGTSFMRAQMKEVEKQMKVDYDVTAMPAAWRSAKAVVLAAIAENLPLTSGTAVLGKTAVETAIKAARLAKGHRLVGGYARYLKAAMEAEALWKTLTTEEQDTVPAHLKWVV